jgi:hypothetical protein
MKMNKTISQLMILSSIYKVISLEIHFLLNNLIKDLMELILTIKILKYFLMMNI